MFELQLTVSNDHLFVVGYSNVNKVYNKCVYKLPVTLITDSTDQQQCASTRWVELTQTTHWYPSLVTGLSSIMVFSGFDATNTVTADIMMYDSSTEKWKKINSLLSFARYRAAATAINNNAIIVIGGYTSLSDTKSTSLTVVELGQVEEDEM